MIEGTLEMVQGSLDTPLQSRVREAAAPSGTAASWPSIIAGAFVAASSSLILITLGAGLGLAAVSPWQNVGASATSLTINAAIWLIVTQWISACLGGYIAGRLRTRWMGTHPHEVFFRDTAHGLITWSVATLFVAAIVTSSLYAAVADAGRTAIPSAATAATRSPSAAYAVDRLFRPGVEVGGTSTAVSGLQAGTDPRAEAAHIMANAAQTGSVPDSDRIYLGQLVVARTGLPAADAQRRVEDFIASEQQAEAAIKAAADEVRVEGAKTSIYMALSLLVGAFIASVSAALGGRLRDEHV